jgi:hypothetical protein
MPSLSTTLHLRLSVLRKDFFPLFVRGITQVYLLVRVDSQLYLLVRVDSQLYLLVRVDFQLYLLVRVDSHGFGLTVARSRYIGC